jgi:hypothetical protein
VRAVPTSRLTHIGGAVLTAVTREGRTGLPVPGGLLESGDLVHVAVEREGVEALRGSIAALSEERA